MVSCKHNHTKMFTKHNARNTFLKALLVGFIYVLTLHYVLVSAKSSSNTALGQRYSMKNIASQLGDEFNQTSHEELGVTMLQKMYSKYKYTSVINDVGKLLVRISDKLEAKLNETLTILNRTKLIIESYYDANVVPMQSVIYPCTTTGDDKAEYNVVINNPNNSYSELPLNLNQVLAKQRTYVKKLKGAVKQHYFLSAFDVFNHLNAPINRCNLQNHLPLWSSYMKHIKSAPKNVMILLDHGGFLSKQQFQIIKTVAKQMLSVLKNQDRVGLLAVSDELSAPFLTTQCLTPNQVPVISDSQYLTPATEHNKYLLSRFVNSLSKGNGITNHSLGFQQALLTIKASNISSNETIMLLYISRGLLSSLTEAKIVLETISNLLQDIDNPVIINTCAVVDVSKPIMYEMHFLTDVAFQNYTKYNVNPFESNIRGTMLAVNSTQGVGLAVARFCKTINEYESFEMGANVALPIWDDISNDLTIAVTVPCGLLGQIGLLGVDVYFSSIAEDVTYFNNYQNVTYAFIIDTKGIAVMHPSYSRPMSLKYQPKFVDIIHLEKFGNFKLVRERLLQQKEGHYVLTNAAEKVKYIWRNVQNWYIVCIVIYETKSPPLRPYRVNWFPSSGNYQLVHHRFDMLPSTTLCRHLKQVATLDAGSLYLSASCFQSPFLHLHGEASALTVQSYMAYLKDDTRLLANPGLREEVRDDVAAMAPILEFLRTQHLTGLKSKYIVRRYLTSPSGVLEVFPGGAIDSDLEPTKRSWYLRAIEHRFKTILTPPYLDAGGAGYIVTIAYATSYIVAAIDVTFGYIYKLMLDRMPFCVESDVKCFMMDDYGYLIYHPNLIDPNGHGPMEQKHIIHKESLVANDILNHNLFIKKMLCNDYADGSVQRYYMLNTSTEDVLTNAVHGEHCVKYQVSAVPGTNVFIGVVNATCEVVATFCPCSMVDRLCLNCNRMEQKECECPCECPLNLKTCSLPNRTFMDNPLCPPVPEQSYSLDAQNCARMDPEMLTCMPIICEYQLTYESCLGVLGCEWCEYDVDGETHLGHPFCISFTTCFNGILGSMTPYGDVISETSSSKDLLGASYLPLGPTIGLVCAGCFLLVIMFYFYRSYSSPSVENVYLTTNLDNPMGMSDLNLSDDNNDLDNHQDMLLKISSRPEPISPYCVATEYRRPLTAADSDHGYSTMTPHDESEHLSFAPVEIDSLEEDCISDATSINTSVSSKQLRVNRLDPKHKIKIVPLPVDLQSTTIPNRNFVIAPVTVHRNMEMTQ